MNELLAIRTDKLTKIFNGKTAVDNVTLSINKGELYGLVGPDGAGKTTTMRLLAGIMNATSGGAWIAGSSAVNDGAKIKEKIGYMPQRFGLYEDLTVMENITFYADLYAVPQEERAARIERLLGFSNLTPFKNRLAGKLSGGMKQKLGLACALIHTPEVLFLDEPTNGVDPVSRRDFWRILYDLLRRGVTIFVSTAYLDEAERCTRIGLMHQGRIMVEDTPGNVKKAMNLPMIEVWTVHARSAGQIAEKVDAVKGVSIYGDKLHITLQSKDAAEKVVSEMKNAGIEVKKYRHVLPSMEDVFMSMVG